jgi:hypothetical protein
MEVASLVALTTRRRARAGRVGTLVPQFSLDHGGDETGMAVVRPGFHRPIIDLEQAA